MAADDAVAFLRALQLADSFFPAGMFAHSQGLEGMVRRGWIATPHDVEAWLANQLARAVIPADGVALLNAHRSAASDDFATVVAIDQLLAAMKLPAELRAASQHSGNRLLAEATALSGDALLLRFREAVRARKTPGNGAVAFGVTCCTMCVNEQLALLAFAHSYAVGILGAALRLIRMTHSESQAVLYRINSVIALEAAQASDRHWSEMAAFTPQLDIASMGHETDDMRMFAS